MDEAAETSYLDYAIHAILLGDDDVEDQVPEMMGMGVISFKMYMTYPRRGMMMPDDRMLKAMELAAADGGIAMVHAENGYCIDYLVDKMTEEGHTGREHYAPSQPRSLEIEAANRAATYAQVTGCPLYIVHLSAREMLGVLERFQGRRCAAFRGDLPAIPRPDQSEDAGFRRACEDWTAAAGARGQRSDVARAFLPPD